MKSTEPSIGRLRELFTLTEDGRLLNVADRASRARAGQEASSLNGGYLRAWVDGQLQQSHRIVFAMTHGVWPVGQVDHINEIKVDNRPQNLRDASPALNQQNQRHARKDNTTGLRGVSHNARGFMARIFADGRNHHLGTFDTTLEAHAAYLDAKRVLHPGALR